MSEESGRVVRIERTFDASAEDVFDAWTSPEVMRRWFHCGSDWGTPEAEVDLRVGGKVRVVMRKPDGTEVEGRGEYTLIERPHRLVMTWTFDDDPSNEQLIELSFSESEWLDHGADGQQRHLDRRAPRRPGRGLARVPRPARAGIGRLRLRTRGPDGDLVWRGRQMEPVRAPIERPSNSTAVPADCGSAQALRPSCFAGAASISASGGERPPTRGMQGAGRY